MSTPKIIYFGVLIWGLLFNATPSVSQPREVICKGTLGKLIVTQVRVPRGYACHLRGTEVRGNVIVESNATLRSSGSRINGSIRVYPNHQLRLDSSTRIRGRILNISR